MKRKREEREKTTTVFLEARVIFCFSFQPSTSLPQKAMMNGVYYKGEPAGTQGPVLFLSGWLKGKAAPHGASAFPPSTNVVFPEVVTVWFNYKEKEKENIHSAWWRSEIGNLEKNGNQRSPVAWVPCSIMLSALVSPPVKADTELSGCVEGLLCTNWSEGKNVGKERKTGGDNLMHVFLSLWGVDGAEWRRGWGHSCPPGVLGMCQVTPLTPPIIGIHAFVHMIFNFMRADGWTPWLMEDLSQIMIQGHILSQTGLGCGNRRQCWKHPMLFSACNVGMVPLISTRDLLLRGRPALL